MVETSSLNLNTKNLGAYLESKLDGFRTLHTANKFDNGQSNPTYLLKAESGNYVLRRKPPGTLLKSAHAVEREYKVMQGLYDSDVPVPQALHLCEDEDVIGSVFIVMSYIDGRTFWKPSLPELKPTERVACYQSMNKTLAAIHSIDIEKAGLADYGKAGNYFERQFSRWTRQYRATETENIEQMNAVINWLEQNMVADDGRQSLVHGDYRIDNLKFSPKSTDIIAVLDWELSTLGHPFADLAYQCALWRMAPEDQLAGLRGVDRQALGIPEEDEYVNDYCRRMKISGIEQWQFYLVFSLFRMAAIIQGVKKRAIDGNASSQHAHELGKLVTPLATQASLLI